MKDCHIEDIVLLPDNMSDFELRKQDLSPEFEEACADESAPSLGEMLEKAEEPAQEAARLAVILDVARIGRRGSSCCCWLPAAAVRPFDRSPAVAGTRLRRVSSSKYFVAMPRALAEWQKWESEPEKA